MPRRPLLETNAQWLSRPRVYSTDEDSEGTVYHLYAEGAYIASAHWPHPLYEMRPDAVSGGDLGGGFNGCSSVGVVEDGFGFLDDWTTQPL